MGTYEATVMRRLSQRSLGIITEELNNPGSWPTIKRVLRHRDVEGEIARQVAKEIERAVRYAGLGDDELELLPDVGFGSLFKKIKKAIKKVAKKVVAIKKIVHPIAKKLITRKRRSSSSASVPAPEESYQPEPSRPILPSTQPDPGGWDSVIPPGTSAIHAFGKDPMEPTEAPSEEQAPPQEQAPDTDVVQAAVEPEVKPSGGSGLFWALGAGAVAILAASGKKGR